MPKVFKWDEINGRGTEQDRVEAFLTDTTDTYAILQLRIFRRPEMSTSCLTMRFAASNLSRRWTIMK